MRYSRILSSTFALYATHLCIQGFAYGQNTPSLLSPLGIPTPGRSIAGNDDASAIASNPANLGFLPSAELRWLWYRTGQGSLIPDRGHAVDLASPFFWGFSGGARVEFVRPPSASDTSPFRVLTAALAAHPSPKASIGLSVSRSYSDNSYLDSLWGATAGLSLRPIPWLGLSGVARNWNGYTNAAGMTLSRAYDIGLTLRPTSTRALELGVETRYEEKTAAWSTRGVIGSPRAVLGVDIPYVGRLRGDVAVQNPVDSTTRAYVATAGLDINAGPVQASGGAIFGNAIGGSHGDGFYSGLAVRGYREPGLPVGEYFVKIRMDHTPDAREHVQWLRTVWRLAEAKEVAGVLLVLKTEPSSSLAHNEEMADALRMLRSRGKKVVCHLEDAGGRSLHLCSQADRIVINPAGGIRFAGMRSQYMYFGDVLSKVGIRTDFVRIGEHKTAPEQFTQSGPTPTADEDHRDLLQQFEHVFLSDVGGGRKIALADLRARIDHGPFVAQEAKNAGLVDSYAFDDELEAVVAEAAGHRVPLVDMDSAPALMKQAPAYMGSRPHITIVYVDGDMIDGKSRIIPLLDDRLVGSYTIAQTIKDSREDPMTRAIVLRLETPGGSSLAADVIWREVYLAAQQKPVIVSMGATAASGGYYIASPGTRIFANRTTVTGSIGIFYGKADIEELLTKLGIHIASYRTAPRADAESIFRPFTEDERQELTRKVKIFYDTFIDRVARGRHMSPEDVDRVGRGRVWTGEQAKAHGLVDRIGGLREAIEEACALAHLPRDIPITELPPVPINLIETILALTGVSKEQTTMSLPVPPELMAIARALAPFTVYEPHTPLARALYLPTTQSE